MKYQVYKTTLNVSEQKKKFINTSIVGVCTISIFITAVWFYPSIYSYVAGGISLLITSFFLFKVLHNKQIILNIDETGIDYLDENDNHVFITWKDIQKVHSSFGVLEFLTEEGIRKLDISKMNAQERWEVKNIISHNSRILNFQFK